jgi:hypothetical protein
MENSAVVWPLCPEREKEEAEFCDSDTVQFKCKKNKNFKTKKRRRLSHHIFHFVAEFIYCNHVLWVVEILLKVEVCLG